MVELILKSDPLRPGWYITEDAQSLSPGARRWRNGMRSPLWRPPTDVYESEEAIIIRVEIAGMHEEDFSISLAERLLTIRGFRPDIQEKRAYHQMEIFFGEFLCEIELLSPVDVEAVTAEYQAGFLRVILPILRAKRVQISD